MIRIFIYCLAAIGIGAWLYLVLGDDPGYVLISFGTWSIESTVVALFISLLILVVLVYGLYKLIGIINPAGLFKSGFGRSRKNAAAQSEEGMRLLLLGHWQQAYKLLVENAEKVDNPVFNYLAAGIAAWQRQDNASWQYCLDQAERKSRKPNPGIRSLKALFEYRSGKLEHSLALLLALDREAPGSPYVLSMLLAIYQSLEDWEKLNGLLPVLEKHKVAGVEQLLRLKEKIAAHSLECVTSQTGGAGALVRQWEATDKKVRRGEEITLIYLQKLIEFSQHEEAMQVARKFLKHEWSDRVVLQTGFIDVPEPGRLVATLEKLLKSRPTSGPLMLSLGRACLRNRLWAKAKEYFEDSLKFSGSTALSAEANAELARLLDHMGEHAQSAHLYGKALEQLNHKLPDLPMPE